MLIALLLGAAIYFLGRGNRRSCTGDLIAAGSILCGLCLVLFLSSAAFGLIGALVGMFGIATILLSFMASEKTRLTRRDMQAIGVGAVIAGFVLTLLM